MLLFDCRQDSLPNINLGQTRFSFDETTNKNANYHFVVRQFQKYGSLVVRISVLLFGKDLILCMLIINKCICLVSFSLPLTYKWRRENGEPFVKGTALSDRNRVLTIKNAPLEAEGNYICTVSRAGVSAKATISLTLESK